jgi:uncharacterized protein (UPF0332 family)
VSAVWKKRVQDLINEGRLEEVFVDQFFLNRLITNSQVNLRDADALLATGSLEGAFVLAYSSARIAATAILYSRGVRPTARGGHWVVADLLAVVDGVEVHVVNSLNRLRILRNEIEYPQSVSTGVTPEIVQLAFGTSQSLVLTCTKLMRKK